MSVWDHVRKILRVAREETDLPRRLISGLSRLGRGSAVTRVRAGAAVAKFTVTLTYRPPDHPTGSEEVLEVALPDFLTRAVRSQVSIVPAPSGEPSTLEGEIGRWIRERFYSDRGFVWVHGVQERGFDAPTEPRLSLPRALPELRKDPLRTAERALRLVPARGKKWYGQITLDLDDVRPSQRSLSRWANRLGFGRAFEWRSSASGRRSHVRFSIREGLRPRAVQALRLALGDDPLRDAIDSSRYAFHGRSALRGVLFDTKRGGRAGPWRSSRNPSRRRKKGGNARGG